MGIMVRCWVGVLEVYLAHIKFWEGFGCQSSFSEGVRRWHVRDGGFDRCHIPACVFIPRPKCSGGPLAGSAVAAGGCCGLLSSSTSPCEKVGLTSLC
jgi:hypothetical protein